MTPIMRQILSNDKWLCKPPADLQNQILQKTTTTLLHNFQTDVIANHGTIEYDENIKYSGVRSLKVTTADDTYAIARVDFGAAGIDLSSSSIALMGLRSSTGNTLATIFLQLWGDGYVNLGKWQRNYGGPFMLATDQWELITFTNGGASPLATNVRYIDIQVNATDANQAVMYFNQLRSIPNPANGYVTITLDGPYIGQYTELKPLLDAKGYKACLMVGNEQAIDAASVSYLSKTQLRECELLGWDISLHSLTPAGKTLALLTQDEIISMAKSKKKWLKSNGFNYKKGGRFIVGLQDTWSEQAVDILGRYFYFLRTGLGPNISNAIQNTVIPVFNPKNITDIASNATYAQQLAIIQAAATHKQWAVLIWHQPGRVGELTLQEMSNMLDAIAATDLQVVTFSDVLDDILGLG